MFTWKTKFSLGISEIDAQHQELLAIGMKLYRLMSDKISRKSDKYDEIMEIIHEIKDYTIYHFEYEEKILDDMKYDQTIEHIREHNAFVNKIVEIESSDIDSFQNMISMDLIAFIASWIEKHILESDMAYVEAMKAYLSLETEAIS